MKIAIRTSPGRVLLLEPGDIYYVEARRGDSAVRTARKRSYRSTKPLGDWQKALARHGFFRAHRSYLVNLERVREIRRRGDDPNDWEVKLDPPVNAVLPLSREAWRALQKKLEF